MHRINRIHFIGIGGVGMSGIAEVLCNRGYEITGSDITNGSTIDHLRAMGVKVIVGHQAGNVVGTDVVVVSSAILESNVEVIAAHEHRIPVVPRAEMLAELMRFHHSIAVSGSHGKTTTASLVASILEAAGQDPTLVLGGRLKSVGSHARLGKSRYFVAEADESDASFIRLHPILAVVTNIDQDHMATFNHDQRRLDEAFLTFLHNLPFYGAAILCGDDPGIRRIFPEISRFALTYGWSEQNDYRVTDLQMQDRKCRVRIVRPDRYPDLDILVPMPGRHNILNAMAAVAVATYEGVDDEYIKNGLQAFSGVNRRMEFYPDIFLRGNRCDLIDDYGHHPTEIRVVVETIRELWPRRRLVMVFQPHRYSRTRDLYDEFVVALDRVDILVMLDVYAVSGEEIVSGASASDLCRSIRQRKHLDPFYATDMDEAAGLLADICRPDDLIVVQGAADISRLKDILLEYDNAGFG